MKNSSPSDFLKDIQHFFKEHKDKFLSITKQVIGEGITSVPIFIVTERPLSEKIGVIFKHPTEDNPYFIFLTALEVLTNKNIISPHNLAELKDKISDPTKKATIIALYDDASYLIFMDY